MSKYYALINNSLVVDVIVAEDDTFLSNINNLYDTIVDVTDRTRPSTGDSYNSGSDSFVSNAVTYIDAVIDTSQDFLHQGTEDGFDSLLLSKYTVSCADGEVTMDCKRLDALVLLDALHKFLVDDADVVGDFTSTEEGPGYGKFIITWDDAQLLYNALIKVRL